MAEVAHGFMVAGALAGAGTTLARGRRLRALDALAALAMLAAMLDTALAGLLPSVAWAGVLVLAGVAIGIRSRRDRSRRSASAAPRERGPVPVDGIRLDDLFHALALIATGWLVVAASHDRPTSAAAPSAAVEPAVHAHAAPMLAGQAIAVLAVVALVALGAWVAVRAMRGGRDGIGHGVTAASMTVMLAAMAAPGLVTGFGA